MDTIMFANVSIDNRKISLVSIPRDLYYQDQKINGVYAKYGMFEFQKEIEDIVGMKVAKYIMVDMYVFVDIIDLMGGVDVTLDEDLVDPTYKTCDNGVCSTLYYPAGKYHLNGTQALRIVRSRHTSSDYSRAARQQLVLQAVKSKVASLQLGDGSKVLGIIKSVLTSTQSNITLDEALLYYFRFQNFDLNGGNVISSGNVLDSVQVPVDYTTNRTQEVCVEDVCSEGFVIDTLSPRNGDWELIKKFVRYSIGQ
ncbi:MAG: LCP family protein [Patescibacteria group bacterium]